MQDEEVIRYTAAETMAHGFIIEVMLANYIKQFDPASHDDIAKTILETGKRTDHFAGVAKNDHAAEFFSDVVVTMHEVLERLVVRALERVRAGREAGEVASK